MHETLGPLTRNLHIFPALAPNEALLCSFLFLFFLSSFLIFRGSLYVVVFKGIPHWGLSYIVGPCATPH